MSPTSPTILVISASPSAPPTWRVWVRDAPIHSHLALHTALRKCRSDGAPECASRGQGKASSGIVSRCRPERLWRSLCDLASARTATARCRSHCHVGATGRLEWAAANQGPSCGPSPSNVARRIKKRIFKIKSMFYQSTLSKYIEQPPCNHGK